MIHPEVKGFLRAWLWWVGTGAEEDNEYDFNRAEGLCAGTKHWDYHHQNQMYSTWDRLESEFCKDGLDGDYPFGEESFHSGGETRSQHLCPERIGWVIKTLEKNPDEAIDRGHL